jgi:sigma-54-specific transcriptional regulator
MRPHALRHGDNDYSLFDAWRFAHYVCLTHADICAGVRTIMSEMQAARLLAFPGSGETKTSQRAKALVFADSRSEALLHEIERLAPSDASVLLVGDTGTGKELIARHIHDHSRREGPFVAINCGAFSEQLVEAELFGHEAGAFTGAQQARAGWFETANGGTLFLDEIGDMPLHLQVKLLRVLQEGQVVRLGSRKAVAVDVRLVAATNVDLERAVEAGRFRRDLYYRLNVAAVRLLPLRERSGDILPLAHYFVDKHRRKGGMDPITLTDAARRALLTYSWPGNIRELENIVHFGVIMCRNGVLDVSDLRLPETAPRPESTQEGPLALSGNEDDIEGLVRGLRRLLRSEQEDLYQSVERLLVTTAFEHCEGNQVRTAKRLGVSRNIVRAQLKRHGLLDAESTSMALPPAPAKFPLRSVLRQ